MLACPKCQRAISVWKVPSRGWIGRVFACAACQAALYLRAPFLWLPLSLLIATSILRIVGFPPVVRLGLALLAIGGIVVYLRTLSLVLAET